jgi:light-regulated signal transduction histidine kinase (bacteriophytochrome)
MVSAEAALQQVLANLAWEVERRAAVVSHGPLPAVFVHESQFLMLLQNLVHNGIKFNQSKPPRVHVAAEDRGGAWAFAVTDNGIGIAAEHAEAVFAMFRRLHDASVYEGSGIGLATCKKIVEHHGGVISVESQPGRGATFCFTLPKPPAEAAAPEA